MQPNCSRNSGVHSAFAPASMRMAWPSFVGRTGENAARRIPRMRLTSSVAAVSSAPVLPAEMNASCRRPAPAFLHPARAKSSDRCFTTAAGSQCMSTTSSALASSTPSGSVSQPWAFMLARISAPRPTRTICTPNSFAASSAPRTTASGALSPPIASRMIFMPVPSFLHGLQVRKRPVGNGQILVCFSHAPAARAGR